MKSLSKVVLDFPGGSDGKASACLRCGRPGFNPWVGKIPWRRKWQSTPVLLPGKSHGQRSLVGYSPWVANSRTRLSNFMWFMFKFYSLNVLECCAGNLGLSDPSPITDDFYFFYCCIKDVFFLFQVQ